MTIQLSTPVRNAQLDAFETAIAASPKLRILSGAQPANCAAVQTGTLLAEIALPADWMNAAATASKTMLGSWTGAGAAAGIAAHFRVVDNAGTTCHCQGSITATGGGGDMTIDNTSIALNQVVNVTSFTLNAGNP